MAMYMDNPNQYYAKSIVMQMLNESKMSLTRAVKKVKETHPDKAISTQNISNKLSRDTCTFNEICWLAEACGYKISVNKAIQSDAAEVTPDDEMQMINQGYASVISSNFGAVVFAGRMASKAADSYKGMGLKDMQPMDELVAIADIEQRYGVISKVGAKKASRRSSSN